jgi:hypothetical protein
MEQLDPTTYETVTLQEYGQGAVLTTKMVREAVDKLRSQTKINPTELVMNAQSAEELRKAMYYLENRDDTEELDLEDHLWNS